MALCSFKLSAVIAAATLTLSIGAAAPVLAQGSAFNGLEGAWGGTGTITFSNGSTERIRCRATYNVPIATNLQMTIRCASDSYKFDLSSSVVLKSGGVIAGTWSETSRAVGGGIDGTAQGGQISARANTAGFSAAITVSTQGKRQAIGIVAGSSSDQTSVNISMTRG